MDTSGVLTSSRLAFEYLNGHHIHMETTKYYMIVNKHHKDTYCIAVNTHVRTLDIVLSQHTCMRLLAIM